MYMDALAGRDSVLTACFFMAGLLAGAMVLIDIVLPVAWRPWAKWAMGAIVAVTLLYTLQITTTMIGTYK